MSGTISTGIARKTACHVCGKAFPVAKLRAWISVRPGVSDLIDTAVPGWAEGKHVCAPDLARFRREYVENLLADERGELAELDRQVIASLEAGAPVSRNPEDEAEDRYAFGERLADRVAEFGGSWTFILSFLAVLVVWMLANVLVLSTRPFDPYPFILLNLVLSCLAALQAPVIMMSQRRQETKDRLRAENDYRVNLKSELEIRQLHEKIDHLLYVQWERMVEIQQTQLDLLDELSQRRR